jgi:hypothetical protein
MTCTHCGATIAAKALICYKCGNATTAPRVKPPAEGSLFDRPRRSRGTLIAAVVLGLLLAGGVLDYAVDREIDFNMDVGR